MIHAYLLFIIALVLCLPAIVIIAALIRMVGMFVVAVFNMLTTPLRWLFRDNPNRQLPHHYKDEQ